MAQQMPFHVQSVVSTRVTTNTNTRTITYTGGHLAVVVIVMNTAANTVLSVVDTFGNVYANIPAASGYSNTSVAPRLEMWYAYNVRGGATTVTVTESAGGASSKIMYVREFGGVASLTDPLDKSKFGTGSSVSPSTGASSATADQPQLVVVGCGDAGSGTSITVGTGFTGFLSSATSPSEISTEYKFTTATGAQTGVINFDNTSAWAIGLATFKGAPVGVPQNYQFIKVGDGMSVSEKIR